MDRFLLVAEKNVSISSSQEVALEAIPQWSDACQAAGIIDDTPSQAAFAEDSSPSSPERVFDVTGSSLCSGASQEPVEFVSPPDVSSPPSPRTTSDAETMMERVGKEDSYNEAFESDRSQSPSRTLSWSLKEPKSPTTSVTAVAAAVEEADKSPVSLNVMRSEAEASNQADKSLVSLNVVRSEAEASNQANAPIVGACATIGSRAELSGDREAIIAEEDVEDRCGGRREGSEADGVGARPAVSPVGIVVVSPRKSPLPMDTQALKPALNPPGEGFVSGSASAFVSLRRKEKSPQVAFSGEHTHQTAFGLERGDTSVGRSAGNDAVLDTLDQMVNSVQVDMQVLDNMVVEDYHSEKEMTKSSDSGDRRRFRVQHGADCLEKVGERGVGGVETNPTHELDAPVQRHVEMVSGEGKSKEPLLFPSSSEILIDAGGKMRSVDNPGGVTIAHEDGAQCSLQSPPRPPRAVQEKLDKLRSQSGKKRGRSESILNLLRERLKMERDMVSSSTVLEAIRLRSAERPVQDITATDLIKKALEVGITLPPPFHKNYFNKK